MPTTQTFSENNKLVIDSENINESGEIHIKGRWNTVEIEQTLPIRPEGPTQLCFDKETYNFFWQRLVPDDVRNDFEVVRIYGA
jgi:hypothetical protein